MDKVVSRLFLIFCFFVFSGETFAAPIKIAALMDLSGQKNTVQAPVMTAVRFAVNQVNTQGRQGFDNQLTLVPIDTRGTVLGSRLAAKKAIQENVLAAVGPLRSSNAIAAAPIFQKASVIMISPTATNPEVTTKGEYIFRTCYTDSFQGRLLADFAVSELKSETTVILTNTKDKYCMGLAESFITHFTHHGGNVLYEADYLERTTDFDAMIEKAGRLKPDVIFIPGYSRDAGQIIKKIRNKNIKSFLLGGDGWGTSSINRYAGNAVDGSFRTSFWHRDLPDRESRRFVEAFERVHGRIQRFDIASAYDAVMILVTAIAEAPSLKSVDVRDALQNIQNFKGVTGSIRFNENGDPFKPAVILRYQNSKPVYYKTVSHEVHAEIQN